MNTYSIRFGFVFLLTLMVANSASALTFGELADQAAEKRDYRDTGEIPPQEAPDYNSRRSISRYSCQVPVAKKPDAPRYNPAPERYGRGEDLPTPRYDPYFDPAGTWPYYGYDDNYTEPGWSRRQANEWWLRRRR